MSRYRSRIPTNQSALESTLEALEPQNCGMIGSTVWYRFTPTQTGTVKITTHGSTYDTAVAVYTGTTLATLQASLVGCNDDGAIGTTSEFDFSASSGTTYRIQIGSVEDITPRPACSNLISCRPPRRGTTTSPAPSP